MVDYNNNNEITKFIDKSTKPMKTDYAAIGIYYIKNYKLLKEIFKRQLPLIHNEYQLSSLFEEYMKKEKIMIKQFNEWEDIGTLDSYKKVTSKKFNCRFFNNLLLDDCGVLTKESTYEKIASEIEWYRQVQKTDFGKMSPKLYDYGEDAMKYGIEYCDYLTLMEYFCYYPLTEYNVKIIFGNLFKKLTNIYKNNIIESPEFNSYMNNILVDKTYIRMDMWNRPDLLEKEYVLINNKKYIGVKKCLDVLMPVIVKISNESYKIVSIVHGDPTLSNILFSPRTQIYRMIDPRGNFDIDTIYGDVRYDIAKLRHCYHGRYDEIINHLFEVEENEGIYYKFYKNIDYTIYDEFVSKEYNIDDIELIEGLLFISMLPLHDDYPDRQKVFFARGIECLNNQIKRRKLNDNN